MITLDYAAQQQNRELLINRMAPDHIDYREERQDAEKNVSYEDLVGIPVAPRRSPWNTLNEDPEAANPKVSDKQVPATTQNLSSVAYQSTGGEASTSGGGSQAVSQSALEAALPAALNNEALIQQITNAVLAALPIVEFTCPE